MNINIYAIKRALKKFDRKKLLNEKCVKAQKALIEKNLDGLICFKPQNTFYFSGFNPILYSHPVVVILPVSGSPVLLVHSLRDRHAHDECVLEDIRLFGAWGKSMPIASDVYTAIAMICSEFKLRKSRLAYEGDFIPVRQYQKLLDSTKALDLVDFSDELTYMRLIKDEYDIKLMRLSAYLCNIGMAAAIANAHRTEIEASIAAETAMRQAWCKELSEFEPSSFGNIESGVVNALWAYSMSGHRSVYGCDCPKKRAPRNGEICLPVVWSSINNLQAEIERTVVMGKLSGEYSYAYEAVLEAQRRALIFAKAGVKVSDLYNVANSVLVEAGFKEYLQGRIGHGIGMSLHEAPSLSQDSDQLLEEGMTITIEPGLIFPNWGAIRNSDSVIVRKNGLEVLTGYPKPERTSV